jgi:hypothetical protein
VIRGHRFSRVSGTLLLAAVVALAPGCTLLDDILPGTPFTPDQPVAEVTVQGKINIDRVTESSEGCSAGRALLWGTARNTGDFDLDDVFIEIDALDAGNRVLATYRVNVFNGEVTGGTKEDPIPIAGTSLAVDESGTFAACTGLAFGAVAGTSYRTDFIIISEIE